MMVTQKKMGKVILAGAGPGDPDLLTIKTARYLQVADVVLTDRLASEDILKQYVNEKAEVIHVGKQCRRGPSTTQATINELLIHFAGEGKLVVRLKGGDVSIYSNILDELQTLTEHQIPYEIIPGITAASGAAAYAGIPLTARDHSTAVRFLTFYRSDIITDAYWKDLAETDDTLVFYMSAETIGDAVNLLIKNNISGDKLMAVIEQATTPLQQVTILNPYAYAEMKLRPFISPTIVIIGKVVALHEQFKWRSNGGNGDVYFKTVENSETAQANKLIA